MNSYVTFATIVAAAAMLLGQAHAAPSFRDTLVWSDEFNFLDFSKWKHEITMGGGGNWEFEMYHNNRTNSFTNNSILHIQPTLTADRIGAKNVESGFTMDIWGADPPSLCTGNAFYGCSRTSGGGNVLNPVQSARIRTAETFSFRYGRLEVRAKLPKGDWIWPAIWMLPKDEAYGLWPASGEIDIVESRGNARGYPGGGVEAFASTLHWGPYDPEDPWSKTHAQYSLPTGDLSEDFHIYGLIWNETNIVTYIDTEDQVVLNVNMANTSFWERGGWNNATTDNPWRGQGNNAPFDQEFYLIMNVAVGGVSGYFPDGQGNKPWTNGPTAMSEFWQNKAVWYPSWTAAMATDSNSMQVDYVRVYQTSDGSPALTARK